MIGAPKVMSLTICRIFRNSFSMYIFNFNLSAAGAILAPPAAPVCGLGALAAKGFGYLVNEGDEAALEEKVDAEMEKMKKKRNK